MIARYLLLAVAIVTGAYAIASWICGLLTDAGVAGAITGAIVILAEGIAYCERRNWERARRTRAEVWEPRDTMPTWTISALDQTPFYPQYRVSQGNWRLPDEHRAMWPHEVGGFE